MLGGTPWQVFVKVTYFCLVGGVVGALVDWRSFIADPWRKVLGWAIGTYAFAALAAVGLWFVGMK